MFLLLALLACTPPPDDSPGTNTVVEPEDTAPPLQPHDLDPDPDLGPETVGGSGTPAAVVINEVMPDNDCTAMDEGLETADWVEIYNAGSEPVALSRLVLSDGTGDTWEGGDGELGPHDHLLLWADEEDLPDHAPFRLSGEGDFLTLSVDGVAVDFLATGQVPGDVSWARFPDGGTWGTTIRPTPGWTNGLASTTSRDPSDVLFDPDRIQSVYLQIPDSSWDALSRSPYEEVPGSATVHGTWFEEVSIRLKGQIGSYRTLNQKAGFKVDLDDYIPNRCLNAEKLTLNNMVQDPTYIHEHLAYMVYRAAGVPAPRLSWIKVYVNGEYFGLYLDLETIDENFLARWYRDTSGPMWEGAYGQDFNQGSEGGFDYECGPEPRDDTPITEVAEVLDRGASEEAYTALLALVDMDEWLTNTAVEALIMHWDGYSTANNYRIYHDPTTDLFHILPWGADQTFISASYQPYDGYGRITQFCMAVPSCRADYDAKLLEVADLVDALSLQDELEERFTWLEDEIRDDPRAESGWSTSESYVASTRHNLDTWPDQVRDMAE